MRPDIVSGARLHFMIRRLLLLTRVASHESIRVRLLEAAHSLD
jgi:hypothetical protein